MSQPYKSVLRQKILKQRQEMSGGQWQAKSKYICDRLEEFILFQEAETVFAYFSFRQEADLSSLFSPVKTWAFPRCVGKSLVWHQWQQGETLFSGKYNILEPSAASRVLELKEADLMLVPTVACDRQGYRLGYGGGFYDRLLASPQGTKIPTVGIVFDYAYIEQLVVDAWDVNLSFVCTETRLESA